MNAKRRLALIRAVESEIAAGKTLAIGCCEAGVSEQWYRRWKHRLDEAGLDGLADMQRSGRPGLKISAEEAAYLRKTYLRSNLNGKAGSMACAARWAAKNTESPLSPEVRAAILGGDKYALPTEVRLAMRASAAEVARYRDPKSGQNDGIYVPGWLRMSDDGSRRLLPGERQVWDDASVNVGVVVPWSRGGDPCSDRYGVRVARFQ